MQTELLISCVSGIMAGENPKILVTSLMEVELKLPIREKQVKCCNKQCMRRLLMFCASSSTSF